MASGLSIVGAGSLGQAFAAQLTAAGTPVVLLATARGAASLHAAGRIRLTGASELDAPVVAPPARPGAVAVTENPADLPAATGVIFTTKAHQLRAASDNVRAAADPEWVAGVQNGIVKDDILAEAFGAKRVLGMATIYSAGRSATGEVAVSGLGRTYAGELDGTTSARVKNVWEQLSNAGIPTECDVDIRSVIWSKACNAAGIFGVSVLTRTTAPELLNDPDLLRVYLSLVRETAAIAAANGVEMGDYVGFPIRTYVDRTDEQSIDMVRNRPPVPAATTRAYPSMTQDLLAGRSLEAEEIFGDLVERAERAGVPATRLMLVRDLCRGLRPRG